MKRNCFLILALTVVQNLFSQSVGIGTANIDPSAKLQVESTNQGLLPPRLTTTQRNAIVNPADGLIIFNTTTLCLEYFNSVVWVSTCQPTVPICYQNCNQIKTANPSSTDGVYTIDVDCAGPLSPMQCYCDMTTDGGGWTLVLNYMHQGNTDPTINIRTLDLPLLGSTTLGTNESGTQYWGHASNSLMNALSFSSIRFYGISSSHSRILHFKTSHSNTISYFKTGLGGCNGIENSFTALTSHNANLPAAATSFSSNQNNLAMTNQPFSLNCVGYHWNIKVGPPNTPPYRWEADDMACTSCCMVVQGNVYNTYHQIWIK